MHPLATEGKSLEVLLIENNAADILHIIEGLGKSRIENHVNVVNDGDEAVDFIFQRGRHTGAPCPDIILINYHLLRKSGWEVLSELEREESYRTIPVVVLTSCEADRDAMKKYRFRVNCFLAKPILVTEVISVIQSFEQYWLSRVGAGPPLPFII